MRIFLILLLSVFLFADDLNITSDTNITDPISVDGNLNIYNSAKVIVNSEVNVSGDLNLSGGVLEINSTVRVDGNFIEVNDSSLIMDENATFLVQGDYNDSSTALSGSLQTAENSYIFVGKDFNISSDSNNTDYLAYGLLEIEGNFYQENGYTNFDSTGLSVKFSGSGDQNVSFDDAYYSFDHFYNLMIDKDGGVLSFVNYVYIYNDLNITNGNVLVNDYLYVAKDVNQSNESNVTIASQGYMDSYGTYYQNDDSVLEVYHWIDFETYILNDNAKMILKSYSNPGIYQDILQNDNSLIQMYDNVDFEVSGDYNLSGNSAVELYDSSYIVSKTDFNQEDNSTLKIFDNSYLQVYYDYNNTSAAEGNLEINSTAGLLTHGFYMYATGSNAGYLTKGYIEVMGDLYQDGNEQNLYADGLILYFYYSYDQNVSIKYDDTNQTRFLGMVIDKVSGDVTLNSNINVVKNVFNMDDSNYDNIIYNGYGFYDTNGNEIEPVNFYELLGLPDEVNMSEDSSYSTELNQTLLDEYNVSIQLSYASPIKSATVNENNLTINTDYFTYTPTYLNVNVSADLFGTLDFYNITYYTTVNIQNINFPPEIISSSVPVIETDGNYTIPLNIVDHDGDELNISLELNTTDHITLGDYNSTITSDTYSSSPVYIPVTLNSFGVSELEVNLSDSNVTVSKIITVANGYDDDGVIEGDLYIDYNITLLSDLNVTGNLILSGNAILNVPDGVTLRVFGDLISEGNTTFISWGNTEIYGDFNGSGYDCFGYYTLYSDINLSFEDTAYLYVKLTGDNNQSVKTDNVVFVDADINKTGGEVNLSGVSVEDLSSNVPLSVDVLYPVYYGNFTNLVINGDINFTNGTHFTGVTVNGNVYGYGGYISFTDTVINGDLKGYDININCYGNVTVNNIELNQGYFYINDGNLTVLHDMSLTGIYYFNMSSDSNLTVGGDFNSASSDIYFNGKSVFEGNFNDFNDSITFNNVYFFMNDVNLSYSDINFNGNAVLYGNMTFISNSSSVWIYKLMLTGDKNQTVSISLSEPSQDLPNIFNLTVDKNASEVNFTDDVEILSGVFTNVNNTPLNYKHLYFLNADINTSVIDGDFNVIYEDLTHDLNVTGSINIIGDGLLEVHNSNLYVNGGAEINDSAFKLYNSNAVFGYIKKAEGWINTDENSTITVNGDYNDSGFDGYIHDITVKGDVNIYKNDSLYEGICSLTLDGNGTQEVNITGVKVERLNVLSDSLSVLNSDIYVLSADIEGEIIYNGYNLYNIAGIPEYISMYEDTPYSFELNASEINLSDANITVSGFSENILSVQINGESVNITPQKDAYGNAWIEFNITENNVSYPFSTLVSIQNINDAPVISTQDEINLSEDFKEYNISLNVFDIDSDSLSLYISEDKNLTIYPHEINITKTDVNKTVTITLASKENVFGDDVLHLTLSDQETNVTKDINISIANVNDKPSVSAPASVSFYEGETAKLELNISDPDMDELNVSITSDGNVVEIPQSDLTLSYDQYKNTLFIPVVAKNTGEGIVSIKVSDAEYSVVKDINVTVQNSIKTTADKKTAVVGEGVTFNVYLASEDLNSVCTLEDENITSTEFEYSFKTPGLKTVTCYAIGSEGVVASYSLSIDVYVGYESYQLKSGWNFISLPVKEELNEEELNETFKNISVMFKYSNGWQVWGSDEYGISEFTTLDSKEGVAVYVNEDTDIEIPLKTDQNDENDFQTFTYNGWYLVGVNAVKNVDEIKDLIASEGFELKYLWLFDNDTKKWKFYSPNSFANALAESKGYEAAESVSQKDGFWIYVEKAQ